MLALLPAKLDLPPALSFVASFAKDTALVALQSLIWASTPAPAPSEIQNQIHKRILHLAHHLAPRLGFPTLLDLSLVYTPSSQLRAVYSSAYETNQGLIPALKNQCCPSLGMPLQLLPRHLCLTQSHPMHTLVPAIFTPRIQEVLRA
ncbi:hypothetical protein DXG01_002420 [Tephrocybe rancida]|nr:hypothetical protein DXG01_002420 [Tephrocybe rancida]